MKKYIHKLIKVKRSDNPNKIYVCLFGIRLVYTLSEDESQDCVYDGWHKP